MIQNKDWEGVKNFVDGSSEVLTTKIGNGETFVDLIIRFDGLKDERLTGTLLGAVSKLEEQTNAENRPILLFCAATGNLGAIKILLKHHGPLLYKRCEHGLLSVHHAALYGKKVTFTYLLWLMTGQIVYRDTYGIGRLLEHPFNEEIYWGKDGTELLVRLIQGNLYAIAVGLLKHNPLIGRQDIMYRKRILDVMAARPFAFRSGSRLASWQRLIYNCIPVKLEENVFSIQTNDNRSAGGDIENRTQRSSGCVAPSIKTIHELILEHMQAVDILRLICKEVIWIDPTIRKELTDVFFKTVKLGIFEFVKEIIEAYRDSIYWLNEDGRTIFHIIILYRRAEVFNLVYSTNFLVNYHGLVDNNGNNILQLAGELLPSSEGASAALTMQREWRWFKAVKELVHPSYLEAENHQRKTPREVFTEQHRELLNEGEKRLEETASSCSVVATLIITVVFAAAFNVSASNDDRGKPNFLVEPTFKIFAISDVLALISSIISVLMFLGILTSTWSEDEFLLSLPRKLITGLVSLFFSIASMMVAFGATIYLVLFHAWKWIFIPIGIIGCLPVTLFALLQFPLLVDMYSSTYGSRSRVM